MAFPTPESTTTTAFASAATSHAADMPAAVNSGDVLVAVVALQVGAGSVTTPSGWTKLGEDTGNAVLAMFAKAADGTEGGTTVDFVSAQARTGAIHVIRATGWHGTVSGGAEAGTIATGTSNAPNPGSLTPSWGSDDTLWIACASAIDDDATYTAAPTGYGNLASTVSGAGTNAGASCGTATRENATTTEDPAAFTLSESEGWAAAVVGIRPAAGGGGGLTESRVTTTKLNDIAA